MRPLRLELEGFASFRDRTEIDFTGADLFVLSGPMGAGKSSIIDAMGFALYGSIARFDNANLVAPVISQGLNQARIRLQFRIGDTEYSAVRLVRRSPRGVTTEGRLECGSVVVAENAREVTEKVGDLLGLNFDQFTKCVVLPQGEFADLLHARASERQDLLVRLLDIGFYRNIGQRARERWSLAGSTLKLLQDRLENDLRNATEEAYRSAASGLAQLEVLETRLAGEEETLQALRAEILASRTAATEAEKRVTALKAIKMPAGLGDMDTRLSQAQAALHAARDAAQAIAAEVETLTQAREALPERAAVERVISLYEELEQRRAAIEASAAAVEAAQKLMEEAEQAAADRQAAAEAAEAERDRISQEHAAYHASSGLKAGDICPICGEKLKTAPKLKAPADLSKANRALEEARKAHRAALQAVERAGREHVRREAALTQEKAALEAVQTKLAGKPTLERCLELRGQIDAADAGLARSRLDEKAAREAVQAAQAEVDAATAAVQAARTRFQSARDTVVAVVGEASPAQESIEASWQALVAFASEAADRQAANAADAREAEATAQRREQEMIYAQVEACAELGVRVGPAQRPRDAVISARSYAEAELKQIDARLAERAEIEREVVLNEKTRRIAGTLGDHLQKGRFERWYLQEALIRLVRGATDRLMELSNQHYSLALNASGNDFVVIDHINADEERPVRTLSGGETFLASLALALALGDDIASLASNGAARLDALFLDEGFGTLDANTLETVATTIEELGARGRMVGIVTHVRELADRIPVQFRVSKEGGRSQVQRLENR